ncbi:MAG TPA: low molecular weight protein arginine phosphatase [Candidatus Coproplasma stercoripullorum]|uniref:Low molecular weight protein arginine phosphatase n=1 Tax=Candidatus Coproplasma stercoripullorum TaxID=2840751 RepID=A0A9D1AH91_9FIRM|nr:low molecular weight protein arginine phosphatase [Candidatus Coproplasma stercoripullorum]
MKRNKILFVCSGNTCRSPMAEAILRSKIKQRKIKWWDVSSCGLFVEAGRELSPNSEIVLLEVGIHMEKFCARQLTQKMIERSSAVICMTELQKQILDGCGKVYSIKDFCGADVPDPYGCSIDVYRATRDYLARACDLIIEKIILPDGGK